MKSFIAGVGLIYIGILMIQAQHFDNSSIGSEIVPFGYSHTATFGQTFIAPNSQLDDWTLFLRNDGRTPQNFEFFLMSWNGSEATGSVLYQSGIQTISATQTNFTPFTVNPNAALTIGGDYVMFINESSLNVGIDGIVEQAGNYLFPLNGGFVFLNNGDNFSQITTTPWTPFPGLDSAYIADFTPIPEPATLSLIGLGGLAALSLFRQRK